MVQERTEGGEQEQSRLVSTPRTALPGRGPRKRGPKQIAALAIVAAATVVIVFLIGLALWRGIEDGATRAALTNAASYARLVNAGPQTYANADASRLEVLYPFTTFVTGAEASSGPEVVSVQPLDETTWYAAARAKRPSGTCFAVRMEGNEVGFGMFRGTCTADAARQQIQEWERTW